MKRKREERRRRRRLKLRTLFMLSLTLIFNTYAWFLYVTTVSTNMQVHVDAWSVNFEVDDQIIDEEFLFFETNKSLGYEKHSINFVFFAKSMRKSVPARTDIRTARSPSVSLKNLE